ncbi:hypothetical protein MKW98_013226, partial [Papaver atlanticum]
MLHLRFLELSFTLLNIGILSATCLSECICYCKINYAERIVRCPGGEGGEDEHDAVCFGWRKETHMNPLYAPNIFSVKAGLISSYKPSSAGSLLFLNLCSSITSKALPLMLYFPIGRDVLAGTFASFPVNSIKSKDTFLSHRISDRCYFWKLAVWQS